MDAGNIWLTTYTGKKFYPLAPTPESIDIIDIAHALSNTCRYSGHCTKFYSVAEHSVRLSQLVGEPFEMMALFHDTAEAYLTDIPSTVKDALTGYRDMENRLLKAILDQYVNISHRFPLLWLHEDELKLVAAECRSLMTSTDGWYLPYPPPPNLLIEPWTPNEAELAFLRRYNELLIGGRNDNNNRARPLW